MMAPLTHQIVGKICVSEHAMNASEEISALNEDLKTVFRKVDVPFAQWAELEKDAAKYPKKQGR